MANNPPAPNDISAAGNTTVAALLAAFNDRLRTIRSWITGGYVASPAIATIDVNNQAVINVPDPTDPQDVVNLRTLKRLQPGAPDETPAATVGGVSFRAVARGYAELSIEDLVVAGPAQLDAVEFVCWAIDETDIGLSAPIGAALDGSSGTAAINNPFGLVAGISTDPAITPSRLNRTVGVGDFLYIEGEVVRVAAVGTSAFTVDRSGWLGSSISSHASTANWYKVCAFPFTTPARPSTTNMPGRIVPATVTPPAAVATNGVPTRWDFAAPNLAVVAIAAAGRAGSVSGPVKLVNYTPTASNMPAVAGISDFTGSPGLRTLSGAAYTDIGVGSTLTAGGFADFLARIQAWHSIRNVYGYLSTGAAGACSIAVLYYSPDRTEGGVLATISFQTGDTLSQPVATADGVEMPVGVSPPNLIAQVTMSGGRAAYPLSPMAGAAAIAVEAGGWLDIVVTVADGATAALTVVVAV